MLVRTLIGVVLLLILGYGLIEALPLIKGPTLRLSSPADGQTFPDGMVPVTGVATHTENLSLDGAPLLIDEQGHFSTVLTLPRGGAILSVTATDRFGRSHTERRTIFIP